MTLFFWLFLLAFGSLCCTCIELEQADNLSVSQYMYGNRSAEVNVHVVYWYGMDEIYLPVLLHGG